MKTTNELRKRNSWGSEDDQDEDEPERGTWASKTEFLLSCAGYAIGIGNVWRFPYLCYRNGGGAFLVPYLLMLFLCGIPLFYMESSIGQFGGTGCITMFRTSPIFKGAGFAIVVVNLICTMYYNVIISYPLLFLAMSFRKNLPWEDCGNHWNTYKCLKLGADIFGHKNESDQMELIGRTKTPADEFFNNHILQISDGIDNIGGIVWPLFTCNLVSWFIVFLCICNGVKSVGKVVYFTATFPFVILFVLLIRGVTLPGAYDGIMFYIMPKWSQLTNLKVWADAALQIFFSLGPGWGGIVNMASYNPFNNNNRLDSILVPILNCGTSIFAGFVVFSVLGFMSHQTGLPVSTVATGGPGLAFVTYPEAITMLPIPHLWAVLFFMMLYLLGMDSCFVQIEAIISSITDAYPKLRRHKRLVAFVSLFILFLGSLVFVTNGGMYILQLLDWYAASISVILICLVETIVVGWTYGCDNFVRDIEFMTGHKVHPWWPLCWKYLTPVILSFIFVTTIIFNTRITYNGIAYPEWAVVTGWCSCLASIVCIPGYAIFHFCKTKGGWKEKIQQGTSPTPEWGPQKLEDRIAWDELKRIKAKKNSPAPAAALANGIKVTRV
ncbi:sodium- and chloride-dependent glycine transporter 1-like isoform X1 [Neodiprion pinetum]|uniref:Transporter n=2 Tax=Neodiprion TaxID=270857 RepID=A0A6J0C4Z1_NEOLC|nr:sodium- and chloride-dependent glycine transporter 1 isoform X1 [Neodiprion lecontei]XP_046466263.1 sodium- and chloride-dependent glycine transporter 1-like isoform X1 [Neodiprion pinetum]